jgi:hypothetical protein
VALDRRLDAGRNCRSVCSVNADTNTNANADTNADANTVTGVT